MRIMLLAACLALAGCLTIETPKAKVRATGSVKKAQVTAAGDVLIEDAGGPIERAVDALGNTGMFAWVSKFLGR